MRFCHSGVKVRFCESLGCGRGTLGHLLMGCGVFRKLKKKTNAAAYINKSTDMRMKLRFSATLEPKPRRDEAVPLLTSLTLIVPSN